MIERIPLFEETILNARLTEQGRIYQTPEGREYPSVTTVLGIHSEDGINQWRESVGNEYADKIIELAGRKGTRLHNTVEKYLIDEPINFQSIDPITNSHFLKIKKFIDSNVDTIYNVESTIYSDILKVAGRLDLLCKIQNKTCIVDFKTSQKIKKKEYITNYFMQGAAYSFMLSEKHSIIINKIVILISVEDEDKLQIFVVNPKDYIDEFVSVRNQFKQRYQL